MVGWWQGGEDQCYTNVKGYISQEDILLICQDYKTYGGYAARYLNAATIQDKAFNNCAHLPNQA
jgi:hypothetical protein